METKHLWCVIDGQSSDVGHVILQYSTDKSLLHWWETNAL